MIPTSPTQQRIINLLANVDSNKSSRELSGLRIQKILKIHSDEFNTAIKTLISFELVSKRDIGDGCAYKVTAEGRKFAQSEKRMAVLQERWSSLGSALYGESRLLA